MSTPVDPDALAEAVRRCAACGQPAHRYGRNEGMDRFDPMACINSLRGRLEEAPTTEMFKCGEPSPETHSLCVLPASEEAHRAGHESAYVNSSRAVWATTGNEWWERIGRVRLVAERNET